MFDDPTLDTTGELARFIASTRFEDFDEPTVSFLKRLVLDGVANSIGGLQTEAARVQDGIDFGSGQGARVLGSGRRASVLAATYVNSSCANALDFDDTYKTFLHPGATAIPPSLAMGEHLSSHGRDILTATAMGYEVPIRLAEAGFPSPERIRQVWGFASWQTLGAAAAASSLLSLDTEATRHALGAAAFNAPVPGVRKIGLEPEDRPLSWTKNNYGWAAMGGVLGVLLAHDGFRSSRTVLDGEHGFWQMAGSDRCDFDLLTAGLGKEFRFLATSFKPYASCRWTHSALDCVRQLRRDGELPKLPDIDRVEVHTFEELSTNFTNAAPDDLIDAQFSLPHLLALELMERSPAQGLREPDLRDPRVNRLAARVTIHHDVEADAAFHSGRMPSRVAFYDRHDRMAEAAVPDAVWGSPDRPFTDDDLFAKCNALIEPVWGASKTDKLINGVMQLDQVVDITTILPE